MAHGVDDRLESAAASAQAPGIPGGLLPSARGARRYIYIFMYEYTLVIKTIRAQEAVWAELQRMRIALGLRTMDEVLQHLLELRKQSRTNSRSAGQDPILALRGLGKEIWKGVDPDEYVAKLREGW